MNTSAPTKFLFFFIFSILLAGSIGAQCPGEVSWTLNPPPENGTYQNGQVVEICAEISDFNYTGFYLLGIVLDLPQAWNMSSIQVTSVPEACGANTGEWLYMENVLLPSIFDIGTGFFYEYYGANGDGDPFNDWGDDCGNTSGNWSFCISATLHSCGEAGIFVDGTDITPSLTLMNDNAIFNGPWPQPCTFTEHQSPESLSLYCCTAQSGSAPGIIPFCDEPITLMDWLIPPYDEGGTWSGPAGWQGNGALNPTASAPGEYTYSVLGTEDCVNSTTLTVGDVIFENMQFVSYCSNEPVSLFNWFPTNPIPPGGVWLDPNGNVMPGTIIDPSVDPPGIYQYHFTLSNGCDAVESLNLVFSTDNYLDYIQEATINICPDSPPFYLLDSIAIPGADSYLAAGGQWIHTYTEENGPPDAFGAFYPHFNVLIDPATLPGSNTFTYALGIPPCTPLFIDLNVNVHFPPNTGQHTMAYVCFEDEAFQLEELMNGNPDPGLTWTDVNGNVVPNLFNPADYAPNTTLYFTYSGTENELGCASAHNLSLNITPSDADAGEYTEIEVEDSDLPFILTDSLQGTPQPDGVWTNSEGEEIALSLFIPGVMPYGLYTYTVNSSCGSDSQQLLILEETGFTGSEWGLSPLPENGQYQAGQIIQFNLGLSGQMTGSGLLHGIIFDLPAGWNLENYISITAPETCGEEGEWLFLESLENDGIEYGTGFYFDGPNGGPMDGDPSNNYGDACATLEFSITLELVEDCDVTDVVDILPSLILTSDGLTGSGDISTAESVVLNLGLPSLTMAPIVIDAGVDNEATYLLSDPAFALIDSLGGNPDADGIWTNPSGVELEEGIFIPDSSEEGVYTYIVSSTCSSDTSYLTVTLADTEVSTNDPFASDDKLQVFPNPVDDFARIILPKSARGKANSTLHVYNVLGERVHAQQVVSDEVLFETGVMAPGIYILNLAVGNDTPFTAKMIVVK